MDDEIIIYDPDPPKPAPAYNIEGVVGQILIDEHASPTGSSLYNEEGH